EGRGPGPATGQVDALVREPVPGEHEVDGVVVQPATELGVEATRLGAAGGDTDRRPTERGEAELVRGQPGGVDEVGGTIGETRDPVVAGQGQGVPVVDARFGLRPWGERDRVAV